ncbi:MAG: hypothetical protein JJT94_08010 [Bernardetiaceae bacterium]|nr:hypothetical protein [Bernardetiaceae bacterium]
MQIKKILSNPILMLVIVLTIVGTVIFISQIFIGKEGTALRTTPDDSNPSYLKLREDISALEKKKWERFDYRLINENIDKYLAATPTPLITEEQAIDLRNLLVSQYFVQLNDTAISFLKNGEQLSHLQAIENELQTLQTEADDKVKAIQDILKVYKDAIAICNEIDNYTKRQKYDQTRSADLESKVKDYQTAQYIMDNRFVQNKINQAVRHLLAHRNLGREVDRLLPLNREGKLNWDRINWVEVVMYKNTNATRLRTYSYYEKYFNEIEEQRRQWVDQRQERKRQQRW